MLQEEMQLLYQKSKDCMHFKKMCNTHESTEINSTRINLSEVYIILLFLDLKNLVERKPTGALRVCNSDEKNIQSIENTFPDDKMSGTHPKESLGLGALSMTLKWIARSKIMTENFLRSMLSVFSFYNFGKRSPHLEI